MPQVVAVAVPVPLPKLLDYLVPPGLAPPLRGCRVAVPLGQSRTVVGVVLREAREVPANPRLKPLRAVLEQQPLLDPRLLELLEFAADYYHHPIGEVLATALPVRLRLPNSYQPAVTEIAYALTAAGRAVDPAQLRGVRQREVLAALAGDATLPQAELKAALPQAAAALAQLVAKGWVERIEFDAQPVPNRGASLPPLSLEQQRAVQRILREGADGFHALLLEGVTGSGKTEVYLACVQAVVAAGRQALLLVPEIGLTPQFVARLRDRLSVRLGLLHSGLSDGERALAWWRAAHGQLDVIVGTRSALFTPLPKLGLIVIDEEHDGSFKQIEGLRYSARDLGLKRAQLCGIGIVLGTATPALETLRNAELGRYEHLKLEQRFGAAIAPRLELIDLRQRPTFEGLSDLALGEIDAALARREQVLVFRNQRGYAPVLICHDCGWHPDCPDCNRPLTWHRRELRLRCHHCGFHDAQPRACPTCSSLALRGQGIGTERLEQFLAGRFKDVPLLRMDRDSLARKEALAGFLQVIAENDAVLIVGTQLLAKGHHWPRVTLVVIVDVDGALFSVDFRAGERLAQLIVQVAGRAGRAERPGRVLLQTHNPAHPLLQAVLRGGYRAALAHEQAERQQAQFPPFGALALLRAEAPTLEAAEAFLQQASAAVELGPGMQVAGPVRAPLERRAGLYRAQLWLYADDRVTLQADLRRRMPALYQARPPHGVRWSLDVDPLDLG